MRLGPLPPRRTRQAFALLLVLVFTAIGMMYLGSAMNWATSTANFNERNNQYQATLLASDAAAEKVVSKMFDDFKNYGQGYVNSQFSTYKTYLPSTSESSYWADYEFNDAQGTTGQVYVQTNGASTTVTLSGTYAGLQGRRLPYRVVVNARQANSRFPITNAVQQDVSFTTIPIFQFAIFYNGLLEFTRSASLDVRGRVHSNSNIYYGTLSGAYQKFHQPVTSTGTITKKEPWFGVSSYPAPVTFVQGKTENAPSMVLPIGTNNTSAAVHKVIEMPPAGESITSPMGKERYYNKAEMLILVSNSTVTVALKTPFTTVSNNIPFSQCSYFLTTNQTFYDQRDLKYQQVTEIDVGKFNTWAATNGTVTTVRGANNPPALLYVADNRNASGKNQSVRLVNGQTLGSRGLTLATPNGLYTRGHFNCPTAAHLGTDNTSDTKPASLVADALTVLSGSWSDAASSGSLSGRAASSTTVNAAVIAGDKQTTGTGSGTSDMSGGAMNLPRLLENWSGDVFTLNGSMVCLYQSTKQNQNFVTTGISSSYFSPPSRNINFDNNFLDPSKLPPGTPAVIVLERLKWTIPPINTVSYNGY